MQLTSEQLEAAAVAAENWPTRRANCDRRFINKYSLINSDDLSCTSTWYLPGQGGWPAMEAYLVVHKEPEDVRLWFNSNTIINIEEFDNEDHVQAKSIYYELEAICPDYVHDIEHQDGADRIARTFRFHKQCSSNSKS